MTPQKGISVIIDAWLMLRKRCGDACPPLWLVGGQPFEIDTIRDHTNKLETLKRYESTGELRWWGYLDSAGISTLLLKTLVLVTHSQYEPGGRVILEAMTEGVPVMATPHGLARDLVQDWKTGFLVDFGDSHTLCARMEHFVRQPLLRSALGQTAKAVARKALDSWRFLDIHCEAYDAVAWGHHIHPPEQPEHVSGDHEVTLPCRFSPTYPYGEVRPSNELVIAFVEKQVGAAVTALRADFSEQKSSDHWIVECGSRLWIVKWPYTRLIIRPMWDPFYLGEGVVRVNDRFRREAFASQFPGFAPVSTDEENQLILRPFLRAVSVGEASESMARIVETLRTLYRQPVPGASHLRSLLDHAQQASSLDEITSVSAHIHAELQNSPGPWNPDKHLSVRLALRQIELGMLLEKLTLPSSFQESVRAALPRLQELGQAEEDVPFVLAHGDLNASNCLWHDSGMIRLIDGEKIHPAWLGEDFASMLNEITDCSAEDPDNRSFFAHLLDAIVDNEQERRVVLSWAAVLTIEDVCRNFTLLRLSPLHLNLRRWRIIQNLLKTT